jgi:hypothetical protein
LAERNAPEQNRILAPFQGALAWCPYPGLKALGYSV